MPKLRYICLRVTKQNSRVVISLGTQFTMCSSGLFLLHSDVGLVEFQLTQTGEYQMQVISPVLSGRNGLDEMKIGSI